MLGNREVQCTFHEALIFESFNLFSSFLCHLSVSLANSDLETQTVKYLKSL